jgi:secretion/DNA translocation related TadE-like protein
MGVCVALAAVVTVGAVATARQHAVDGAADLAAVAAAAAIQRDHDACAAARVSAVANRVVLVGCAVHGERVDVRTASTASLPFGLRVTLVGHAAAGPADCTDQVTPKPPAELLGGTRQASRRTITPAADWCGSG